MGELKVTEECVGETVRERAMGGGRGGRGKNRSLRRIGGTQALWRPQLYQLYVCVCVCVCVWFSLSLSLSFALCVRRA